MNDNVSNNPQFALLRERVDDLQAYLELWNRRSVMTDKAAARAAGSMAMERISAAANQLAGMSGRLLAELKAYDDGVRDADDKQLHVRRDDDPGTVWTDTGSGPGYDPRD